MKSKRSSWVTNPIKKQVVLYSVLWFTGVVLTVLAATNFFTESPFVKSNVIFLLVVILPSVILIQTIRNYFINKEIESSDSGFKNK